MSFKSKIIITFILISLVSFILPAHAAQLFFVKDRDLVHVGEEFSIVLKLNTENQSLNALETSIQFPSELLTLEKISNGNSALTFWLQKPNLDYFNQTSAIDLSGITPGGINNSDVNIVTLNFRAQASGHAVIKVKTANAYLNAPTILSAAINNPDLSFDIVENNDRQDFKKPIILDFYPPEQFDISLARSDTIFNGKWFISFNAQDKGSGINHYEVRERLFGIWGTWRTADNPVQLRFQSRFSIIEVRAVDNIGLERVSTIIPQRFYLFCIVIAIALVLLILLLILKLWGKFRK